jgi:putative ABC transport system ATP-binding protein
MVRFKDSTSRSFEVCGIGGKTVITMANKQDESSVDKNREEILVISGLHKRYNEGKSNEVHAIRGLDLTVRKGDMMAIMGPSGCGKTTLLNMIGHLDRRSEGKIVIDGIDTATLSDSQMTAFRRDNIGFIFQLFNLFQFLSAVENVETPLLLKGVKAGVAREQAKMLLREVGMGDRLYHLPRELSGGQQQRVAVGRALINEPAIILGDEPTGDLDSTTSADIMNLFRRINKINRQTFVLVTHNRWIAEQCDYIVHMTDGKIVSVEQGPFTTEEET